MKKNKTIIIDDEPNARYLLREMIKAYCPDLEVIAECEDLPKGVKAIIKYKPDLVFLDIEMPGYNGLEILDFFEEDAAIHFSIIFTTAYDRYAIKAFKLSAIDYLLKPIEPDELENAVKRFKKREQSEKEEVVALKDTRISPPNESLRIAVPIGNGIKILLVEEIVYFKADNSYTEVRMKDKSKILVSRSLKNFEDTLSDLPHFFRTGKSFLVNIHYVEEYIKSDGGYLMLKDGLQIPIASERVPQFLTQIAMVNR